VTDAVTRVFVCVGGERERGAESGSTGPITGRRLVERVDMISF